MKTSHTQPKGFVQAIKTNKLFEGIMLFAGPLLFLILGINILYIGPRHGGFTDIIGAVYLAMGIIAIIFIGIFAAINKWKLHWKLNWWKNLLISAGANILAVFSFIILARAG